MAQLPVYQQQGAITTRQPGVIRDLDAYSGASRAIGRAAAEFSALANKWQEIKDTSESLDAKNKLVAGMSDILTEAENYNDYKTPEDLDMKRRELSARMAQLTGTISQGFTNNRNAQLFESNAQIPIMVNQQKLDGVFRDKTIDMWKSNALISEENNMNAFVKTGDEGYKKSYFQDIDNGVAAGFLDRTEATALKLKTNDWNFDYAYSQIASNPYAKISPEIMSGIDTKKQVQLRNFQKAEQKRAHAEALADAEMAFYSNPTQENLNRLYKLNPKLRKLSGKYEKNINTPANLETVTNFEGYAEAADAIKDLATIDTRSYNGKMEYLKQARDIAFSILKNNTDKSGNATISAKDKDALMQMIFKGAKDETFKAQLANLPDLSKLKVGEITNQTRNMLPGAADDKIKDFKAENFKRQVFAQRKINDIANRTSEAVLYKFIAGDYEGGQRVYNEGLKEVVKARYWYIPELQNPNLQAGQKFTINDKVYTFQGFSGADVVVETNQ